MSTITGKNWSWGFRFDAYGPIQSNGYPVHDEALGALDAPGCIPCGSTVLDDCVLAPATTAIIRSTGKLTDVCITELLPCPEYPDPPRRIPEVEKPKNRVNKRKNRG